MVKKKSVFIIYAGTVSPFSANKEDDIRAVLDIIEGKTICETRNTEVMQKFESEKGGPECLGKLDIKTDVGSIGIQSDNMNGESSTVSSSLSVRVVAFPHCGHNIPLQVPDELASAIYAHLCAFSSSKSGCM